MGITRTIRDIDNFEDSVTNYHNVEEQAEASDVESEAVSEVLSEVISEAISEAVVDFDDEVVFIETHMNDVNAEITRIRINDEPRRQAPRLRRRTQSESQVYFLERQVVNPKKIASLGKRAARRYANSMQLIAFAEKDPEFDGVDLIYCRTGESPFYGLLSEGNSQECSKFINGLGLEEIFDKSVFQLDEAKKDKPKKKSKNMNLNEFAAETAFRKISNYQRSLFKGRNSPRTIIETQENVLVNFFEISPAETWESDSLSDFERLIMHGVTEYYQLQSKSIRTKHQNKLMRVSNHKSKFSVPPLSLTEYLNWLDLKSNRLNSRAAPA